MAVTEPDVVVAITATPSSTDRHRGHPGRLPDDQGAGWPAPPGDRFGSGAPLDPADPTLDLAIARDGTAVQLRPLRRDERQLLARFLAGLSAESRRRWCLCHGRATTVLLLVVGVALLVVWPWWP